MLWLNMIGTIAVGAALVLAVYAVYDILVRAPRERQTKHNSREDATRAGTRGELKRSEGTER